MIHIVYHSTSSFKFTQSEYSHTVMHSIIVIYIMLLILARQNLPYPTHLKEHLHPLRCSKAGIRLWIVPRNRPSLISCPFCFSLLFLRIRYIGYKLKMKFQIAQSNVFTEYKRKLLLVLHEHFLPFPRFLHLEQATQQVMSSVKQSDVIAMMTPRFEEGTY